MSTRRREVSLGEKVFWTVVALSTIGAAVYGYQRFKQIRPDLYGTPQAVTLPEDERKARIAEYQQKGDALTRAAAGRATRVVQPVVCVEGIEHTPDGNFVVENGQPVHCAKVTAPP